MKGSGKQIENLAFNKDGSEARTQLTVCFDEEHPRQKEHQMQKTLPYI